MAEISRVALFGKLNQVGYKSIEAATVFCKMRGNPVVEYQLPEAILKFRQGFGRLIRTKTDRGVAIILDKRISSRGYGKSFLSSLPETAYADCALQDLKHVVVDWLAVASTVR